MLPRRHFPIIALVTLFSWACSSKESSTDPSNGGSGGFSNASTSLDGSGGTGEPGESAAGTSTQVVSTGSVQNSGPPCKPTYRDALIDRSEVEAIVTLTNDLIDTGLVINPSGVFFSTADTVQRAPLTGGDPATVTTGPYSLVVTLGNDLLLSNNDASTTVATIFYRVASTSVEGTPSEVLKLSLTESLLSFDEQFLYLYDTASTSILRASMVDGSRATVASAVTRKPNESIVYGDYLYYENDVYVVRVPKAGGTPENFYYDFSLWRFDISQDKLLVGVFANISVAPLSTPTPTVTVASVPSGMFGSYIDWMTVSNGRIFYQSSDDGFGWVNLAGTQCEGLFIEDMFFGSMQVFDGYVYVQDDTTIRRMKLPQ